MREVVKELKKRIEGVSKEDKMGWYYRHWKGMNLDKKQEKTYTVKDWDTCRKEDPLFQPKVKKPNTKDLKVIDAFEPNQEKPQEAKMETTEAIQEMLKINENSEAQ